MKRIQYYLKFIFCIAALFLLTNYNNNFYNPKNADGIATNHSINNSDNIKFTNLLRSMYEWYETKGIKSMDFDVYSKDSLYAGIDSIALRNRLTELQHTDFFSQDFLNNYKKIAQEIDNQLKHGTMKFYKGDLPPYGSEANPWCNCQDNPDNYWKIIETKNIKINGNSASLSWTWGGNFLYRVKLKREHTAWKISYLEGFDFNSFFYIK